MSKVKKFTKAPVEIEAIRYDENRAVPLISWVLGEGGKTEYRCREFHESGECDPTKGHDLSIVTLEGEMEVKPGAWVIRGIKGEFYTCDDEIFRLTHFGEFDGED